MDAYIYQAALLCGPCGEKTRKALIRMGKGPENPRDEHTYDSDDFPKGPYSDGGGEADSPQHCDQCDKFLENDLTSEGQEYVEQAVKEDLARGRRNSVAVKTWAPFYDIDTTGKKESVERVVKMFTETDWGPEGHPTRDDLCGRCHERPIKYNDPNGFCATCRKEVDVRDGKKEAVIRIVKKLLRETGEMGSHDIAPGGEHYEWAQAIRKAAEDVCSYAGSGCRFKEMRAFDVYQGPYAVVSLPGGRSAKLWDAGEEGGFEVYLEFRGSNSNTENGIGWKGEPEEVGEWLKSQLKGK